MKKLVRARHLPLLAFIGILVLFLSGGLAQAAGPPLQIRAVDATGGTTNIDVVNGGVATAPVHVSIDDKDIKSPGVQSFDQAGVGTDVMVVLDNAESTGNGATQLIKEKLTELAPGHDGISTLGVVTIGDGATLTVPQSSSMSTIANNADPIASVGVPALWDGIVKAANTLGSNTATSHQVVVITAAGDGGSVHSVNDALAALSQSHSVLHVVALTGGTPDLSNLNSLVSQVGGSVQTGTSDDVAAQLGNIATQISHQYRITVPSPAGESADLVPLHLSWGPNDATASYRLDQYTSGTTALAPITASDTLWTRLSSSALVEWLIVILGTASVGMLFYSLAMLATRSGDGLDFALRHYEGAPDEDIIDDGIADDDLANKGIAASAAVSKVEFIRKAVNITGDLANRQGALVKIEELLERADLPLRPAEALFFYAATVVVVAIAALVLSGSPLVLLMFVLIALLVPNFVVKFRAKRRKKKFVAQLPDMLQLLSGTLRAGYSIAQGMEAVSTEVADPMGRELRRVMVESRLGRPLEEALDAAAERTQSEDFAWAVMAIRIQREVGGNLAELLMTVAETMVQRERLRRDVASLTAEGRMSAYILGCLPPGIAAVICVTNKDYIMRLTQDGIGIGLIITAVVSMLIGFVWMNKIIKIEI